MMIKEASDVIRTGVSSQQIAELYGYRVDRDGYISCPFHREKTPSLKLHKSGWYCYGCGKGGSVIDFVMQHDECTFIDAVKAIDQYLQLGLIANQRVSLTASVSASKRISDFEKIKAKIKDAINDAIRLADGFVRFWWEIYQAAYSTLPQERTASQCDDIHNAREWCMYYEDIQNELRKLLEEVKAWKIKPSNHPSA